MKGYVQASSIPTLPLECVIRALTIVITALVLLCACSAMKALNWLISSAYPPRVVPTTMSSTRTSVSPTVHLAPTTRTDSVSVSAHLPPSSMASAVTPHAPASQPLMPV